MKLYAVRVDTENSRGHKVDSLAPGLPLALQLLNFFLVTLKCFSTLTPKSC